jgi:hypothetical protein
VRDSASPPPQVTMFASCASRRSWHQESTRTLWALGLSLVRCRMAPTLLLRPDHRAAELAAVAAFMRLPAAPAMPADLRADLSRRGLLTD